MANPAGLPLAPASAAADVKASVVAAASHNAEPRLGPLPAAKTVTITFAPDWIQPSDPKAPLVTPSSDSAITDLWTLIVVFGPNGTQPHAARLKIQIRFLVVDPSSPLARNIQPEDVAIVGLHQRAALWAQPAVGQPAYTRFSSAVVFSGTRIVPDDLHTQSIVLRPYSDESDVHALVYRPAADAHAAAVAAQTANPLAEQADGARGYIRLLHGKKYYLNFTFGRGSAIAQFVGGPQAWRPLAYLVKGSTPVPPRQFTNFVTNWAQGTEFQPPDALERAWMTQPQPPRPTTSKLRELKGVGILSGLMQRPFAGTGPLPSAADSEAERARREAREQLLATLGVTHFAWPHDDVTVAESSSDAPWDDVDQRFNLGSVQLTDNGKPLPGIALPSLDARRFRLFAFHAQQPLTQFAAKEMCLSLRSTQRFMSASEWPLGQIVHAVEAQARLYTWRADHAPASLDAARTRLVPMSRVLLSLLNVWAAVPAWTHVARFVDDPTLYVSTLEWVQQGRNDDVIKTLSAASGTGQYLAFLKCERTAEQLLHSLCHRMAWAVATREAAVVAAATAATEAGRAVTNADPEPLTDTILRVISADRVWIQASSSFLETVHQRVQHLQQAHQQRLQLFRDSCSPLTRLMQQQQQKDASGASTASSAPPITTGVSWPHSHEVKSELEATGWKWKPTMLKRDRMECATCKVTVSGWRSWHNPWSSHDLSKHPRGFVQRHVLCEPDAPQFTALALTSTVAARRTKESTPANAGPSLANADAKLEGVILAAPAVAAAAAPSTAAAGPAAAAGAGAGGMPSARVVSNVDVERARVFGSALSSMGAYQAVMRQQQQQQQQRERAADAPSAHEVATHFPVHMIAARQPEH